MITANTSSTANAKLKPYGHILVVTTVHFSFTHAKRSFANTKRSLASGLLVSILVIIGYVPPCLAEAVREPLIITTAESSYHFQVEVAQTEQARKTGLMERQQLAANRGMLFIYKKPRQLRMWMKNTPLSLDMLFIDSRGKIIQIAEKNQPYSTRIITSKQSASAVLELLGGQAQALGITVGNQVTHPFFSTETDLTPTSLSPTSF